MMKKKLVKKPQFNRQEKAILKVMYESGRAMTTKEIAEKAHISWITTKKWLKILKEREWIGA